MGRRPSARATARKGLTPSAKTWHERGDSANGIDKRDQRQEKAEGTLRTEPESVSEAHRRSVQGLHLEGARDGMGERLRHGLKLRNKRETGVRPLKGKNQRERLELSQTRSRSEGHSKRAGSHRAQREISGSGRSRTRRRYFQAQKTTCGHEEVQRRWSGKLNHSHGSTMERSNNFRRHEASARTTRKEGASGRREQRGASDRGSNPIR